MYCSWIGKICIFVTMINSQDKILQKTERIIYFHIMFMSASSIKRKSTLLLREATRSFIFRSATTFPVAGFVYQAEKVGFRQQEIIHGSVNFENYTLFSACAHEYNWQKTRQKIKNPTLNFTKCWISEV